MTKIEGVLVRTGQVKDLDATLGLLTLSAHETMGPVMHGPDQVVFECRTMEKGWHDNKPYLSCIPAGIYTCVRDRYHRGGYTAFEIVNVPGRSRILIHVANFAYQLKGCIAPGRRHRSVLDVSKGQHRLGVTSSRITFNKMMDVLANVDEFELQIAWEIPEARIDEQ